jgi:hypothetical protein
MVATPVARIPFAALLVLGGCATSRVPEAIRDPALPSPAVTEVQQRPETFIGQRVRWGGSILDVHNAREATRIEILARPLNGSGEPEDTARGLGRFIVELPGFKDPRSIRNNAASPSSVRWFGWRRAMSANTPTPIRSSRAMSGISGRPADRRRPVALRLSLVSSLVWSLFRTLVWTLVRTLVLRCRTDEHRPAIKPGLGRRYPGRIDT